MAAYVGAVAGQRGKDEGLLATAGPKASNKPIPAKGGVLMMPADPNGGLFYASTRALAKSGSLKVESKNVSSTGHDIALKDASRQGAGRGQGRLRRRRVRVHRLRQARQVRVPLHRPGP